MERSNCSCGKYDLCIKTTKGFFSGRLEIINTYKCGKIQQLIKSVKESFNK